MTDCHSQCHTLNQPRVHLSFKLVIITTQNLAIYGQVSGQMIIKPLR